MANIDGELAKAIQVCNKLSCDAKDAGDMETMYAANRAWTQLFKARKALANRRPAVPNGNHGGEA